MFKCVSILLQTQLKHFRNFSKALSTARDTIFALSSGHGKCGVAVIRVSGPQAPIVLQKITKTQEFKPRYAKLQKFFHPISGELIDKGLTLWFPSPNSFTGEDSCEFQCHGGPAVIEAMLNSISQINSCRPAEPGEFTKRAFFAGKLDLTEVEGLADLIHAETEAQRKQALIQATGNLSKVYGGWRQDLLKCIANVEAYIDFAEDENIEDDTLRVVKSKLGNLSKEIDLHLIDGRKGERLREGVRTVIIGAPNVGKSSLINLLTQKSVSIVTNIAGTTRDIIESHYNIGGYPVLLADTAGLRQSTTDVVENEGIERAKAYLETTDLILLVIDVTRLDFETNEPKTLIDRYLDELGIERRVIDGKMMSVIFNKVDLLNEPQKEKFETFKTTMNAIKISCLTGEGIESAVDQITNNLRELCGSPTFEHPVLSQARHRHHLTKALESINGFLTVDCESPETDLAILAQELRRAVRSIGKITGEVDTEEILDVIFRDFCIGK